MDLHSLLNEEEEDDFFENESDDLNGNDESVFCSLNNVRLDCFLSENSGLFKDVSNPNNLCYFELPDLIARPPYTFKQLIELINGQEIIINVTAARRITTNKTIRYVANAQSVQIRGKVPPALSHITRRLGGKIPEEELQKNLQQKIEAASVLDSVLKKFHKISPETILGGSHWLSNILVGEKFEISSIAEDRKEKKSPAQISTERNEDKVPKNVKFSGPSKNRQANPRSGKKTTMKSKGSPAAKSSIIATGSSNPEKKSSPSENQEEPATKLRGSLNPTQKVVKITGNGKVDKLSQNEASICKSSTPGVYILKNWKIDCFLNERYGLLKDPLDPTLFCYFELSDLVLTPPFALKDLIKQIQAPGISLQVNKAMKVGGNQNIQFTANSQSIMLLGRTPSDIVDLRKKQQNKSSDASKANSDVAKKIKACRLAEGMFGKGDKISLESILSGSHELSDGIVNSNYQLVSSKKISDKHQKTVNTPNAKSKSSLGVTVSNSQKSIVKSQLPGMYTLNNWRFDCFLNERYGLLKNPNQPSQSCYFELRDLGITPPFSFKDVVILMSSETISIQVLSAVKVSGNKKIEFAANFHSIYLTGEVPKDVAYLQIEQEKGNLQNGGPKVFLARKIESCRKAEQDIQKVQKISPESILSGAHWLAEGAVDRNYLIVSVADIEKARPKSQTYKSQSSLHSGKKLSSQSTDKQVLMEAHKTVSPKLQTKPKKRAILEKKTGITLPLSKAQKTGKEKQEVSNTQLTPQIQPTTGKSILKSNVSGQYSLTNWQLDCFLNERYGLLKDPSDPQCLCYFELRDLVLLPPYSFRDLITLMRGPKISVQVRSATKIGGAKNIQFTAHSQSIVFQGEAPENVANLRRQATEKNKDSREEKLEIAQKIASCRSADRSFRGDLKIPPESILDGSHWLAQGAIDSTYLVVSVSEVITNNPSQIQISRQNKSKRKSDEKVHGQKELPSKSSAIKKTPKSSPVPQPQDSLKRKKTAATELPQPETPVPAKKPKPHTDGMQKSDATNKSKSEALRKKILHLKQDVQKEVKKPIQSSNAPGIYILNEWQLDCFLNERYGLLRDPSNPQRLCYFEIRDLVIPPPYLLKDAVKFIGRSGMSLKVSSAVKVSGNKIIEFAANFQSVLVLGHPQCNQFEKRTAAGSTAELKKELVTEKIKSCREAEGMLRNEIKISLDSIVSGTHWLSEGIVDSGYQLISVADFRASNQNVSLTHFGQLDQPKSSLVIAKETLNTATKSSSMDTRIHFLNQLQLDCFLNERYGILKHHKNPAICCFFELSDIVVTPPYAFRDLVNLMMAPGISLRTRTAKKVSGNSTITFCAQFQSISVVGKKPDNLAHLQTPSRAPNAEIEERRSHCLKEKIKACTQAEKELTKALKIVPKNISDGSHWLAEGVVNRDFQIISSEQL